MNNMQQDNNTTISDLDKVKFAIGYLFHQAHQNVENDENHVPCNWFMVSLYEWCQKTGKDFRVWQLSMYRLFSLKSKHPYSKYNKIVNFVIDKDKEKLGL